MCGEITLALLQFKIVDMLDDDRLTLSLFQLERQCLYTFILCGLL